ncbi:zinc-finger homeodomain protein 6-like [Musa acuminata AAA Group]|uniref:zinc-finger homeodomain protein 6-like n=1 Tax=Musa acuminata AAA Group TaxID=214697 RepID=UPI0031D2B66A
MLKKITIDSLLHLRRNARRLSTNLLQNGNTRGRIPRLLPPPLTPHYHNLKPSRSSGILLQTGNSIGASVGAATESSSEELMDGPPPPQHQQHQFIVSRKRIRTKFTAEQQEGMLAFAEQDGAAVEQFCCEVGVRRKVFITTRANSRKQQQQQQEEEVEQQLHHERPDDRGSVRRKAV